MAINRFMRALLRAVSHSNIDIQRHYKMDRLLNDLTQPPLHMLSKIQDIFLDMAGYSLRIRNFTPKQQRTGEVILFFHGGGWVTGNIGNYTQTCSALAEQTGRRVLSLNYRLAPEFPFPRAVFDCYETARQLFIDHIPLDIPAGNIVLMGDSAGGNLAAVVSLMAAENRDFHVSRQILLYPLTYNDHSASSPFLSVRENGTDYLLTAKQLEDYTALYLPDKRQRNDPHFAPLLSDHLEGQPRTLIVTAEFDPLRDEGEAYGQKLRQFGNDVQIYRIRDALHGFFSRSSHSKQTLQCYQYINAFLDGADGYGE